jgi:Tetratricopeptide repeat
MNTLALAYGANGRKEEALELAEEHLELCKRHRGPNHPVTLVAMNNVASLYQEQKQQSKALSLFEKTYAGMQTQLAPLHPERINTAANLARVYYVAEQLDKAVPLQETVVQQFKTAYGLDDARTQNVFYALIGYYADIGWCDKAEAQLNSIPSGGATSRTSASPSQDQREKRYRDLIQRVRSSADNYQRQLAAKKADHPDTLAARQAFAVTLRRQNRTIAAAYHLRAVLDVRRRMAGDDSDTQVCRLELGMVRLQQKNYAEAESLLLEAYAGLKHHESASSESKSRLTTVLQRIVQLYDGWGKKDQAMEWRQNLDEQKKP